MKSSNLHIKYISLPKDFLFRKQITKLLDQIHRESLLVLNSSERINKDRIYSSEIIIQGLYECYKCLTPKASLSIPLHQSAYSKIDITKITTHTYRVIYPIIEALENLGWVNKNSLSTTYSNWLGDKITNVHEKKWRNKFFWDKYSDEQLKSLVELCEILCEQFNIPKKFIGHNTKINGVEKFKGIINRSNLSEDYTDLSPAFNFVYLLENFNDEQ
jgi:hypothetical protein